MTPTFTITAGQRTPSWPMQLLASGDIAWGAPGKQSEQASTLNLSDVSPVLLHLCLYGGRQTLLREGSGQWSIVDSKAGVVLYSPATEDVSIPGEYLFKVRIDHVGGTAPYYSRFVAFRIEG
jgi:hypothetical protein